MVQCTYISIPQVPHTFAVLLAKPFWIWGAEMGVNEHGVCIGNEALFTKVPYETAPGLIGMDFLRLALERAKTSWEAVFVITRLLEEHGQSGSCGFTHPFYYHNSFLIADPHEAWVLETAGRHWVAEKVKDVRSISNAATIGATWDLASDDLVSFAVERGWCKDRNSFHFARCYSDFTYTTLSDARSRQSCTTGLLQKQQKNITPQAAMEILRTHNPLAEMSPRLDKSLIGATVCMHAGAGPVRNSQSTGSLVAHLSENVQTCWVTGTSAPCTGVFKPVWLDAGYPLDEPAPTGTFDERCLWWRHERLHRAVLENYAGRIRAYRSERDDLEKSFVDAAEHAPADAAARRALSADCFQRAGVETARWLELAMQVPFLKSLRFYYSAAWRSFGKQANAK